MYTAIHGIGFSLQGFFEIGYTLEMFISTRYVLRHLCLATFFVACVLVIIVWMTQSLRLVDILVHHGISLGTFVSMMLLLIPDLVGVILPFALVIGLLFVYARLYSDSELIALRASGLSDRRLAIPGLLAASLVALVLYSINFYFLPASFGKFKDMESQVRRNMSASLVKPGEFMTFEGVTVYVRKRERSGKLAGILIYDARHTPAFTLVAREGVLTQTLKGARIFLHEGARQEKDAKTHVPSLVTFERYALDIESLEQTNTQTRVRKPYERFLPELLPNYQGGQEFSGKLWVELHQRLVMPLICFAFVLICMALFLSGDYNRRGRSKRMTMCVLLCAGLEIGTFLLLNLSEKYFWIAFVAEFMIFLGIVLPLWILFKNDTFCQQGEVS